MSGEFSIFDLNNQLPHSSNWLICPPQSKELRTVATINYLCIFGNFTTPNLAATYINTNSFKEPSVHVSSELQIDVAKKQCAVSGKKFL
jgi:hypothetical protein